MNDIIKTEFVGKDILRIVYNGTFYEIQLNGELKSACLDYDHAIQSFNEWKRSL